MSAHSDEELLLAAGRGDEAAFQTLVSRYADELLGYFRRRAGDEAAEDLLQETLLRLHKAAPRFVPQATFRTYLYTIARNLTLNYRRDFRPSAALDPQTSAAPAERDADPLESAELSDRVRRAVEGLSEPLRDVVLLRHYQGLSFREIAGVLRVPEGTAMRRMSDALLRLRDALGKLEGLP
jgi:RNA polymerase sigma-70 factor (ECF subfamily)